MINKKIVKLRKQGFSLREISKKVGTSYTTTKRRCKEVVMSKKGKERYHQKVPGIIKKVKINHELNKIKVRIISNLLFDGAVYKVGYHHKIMYVNASKKIIEQFKDDIEQEYGVSNPTSEEINGKNVKCYRVTYHLKEMYEDLLNYMKYYSTSSKRCSIPKEIMYGKGTFKIIILRAFWENEGSIAVSGKLSADLKNLRVIFHII